MTTKRRSAWIVWLVVGFGALASAIIVVIVLTLIAAAGSWPPSPPPATTSPAASTSGTSTNEAINIVAPVLNANHQAGVTRNSLRTLANPEGEGIFVYSTIQQSVGTARRQFLWLVIDGRAYALNGSSKDLTPALPFARDAPDAVWARTNLNRYNASQALQIVFGKD